MTYENLQLGIRIEYPQSWKPFFEQVGKDCFEIPWCEVEFVPLSTSELGYGDVHLGIAKTSFKGNCSCDTLLESIRYYYQLELKSINENPSLYNFNFLNDNHTKIGGNHSAWEFEYKHSFDDAFDNRSYDVRVLKVLTKYNESEYIFDYSARSADDFAKYLPDVQAMIDSIEFLPPLNKTGEKVPSFL